MMLFAHLEPTYARRAWAIVDSEPSGTAVIQGLRAKYRDWPSDRFVQWEHGDFERFYPAHFSERVTEVLSRPKPGRRDAKKALLADVVQWISDDEPRARAAFKLSAASAIQTLQAIEASLSAP